MKYLKLIVLVLIFNCSCNTASFKLFTVKGKIKNYAYKKVFLISFENNESTIILDSTTSDKNGKFVLKTIYQPNELLAVQFEESLPYWIVSDVENLSLNIDNDNYKSYTIKGSSASDSLKLFIEKLSKIHDQYQEKNTLVDSLIKKPISDSLLNVQKQELKNMHNEMQSFCKKSIFNTNNPALKYFYIYYGLQTKLLNENLVFKELSILCDSFPKHQQLLSLKNSLAIAVKSDPKLFLIDSRAPNFSILDSSKNLITLETFAGKFLLLNFWSSKNFLYRNEFKELNNVYQNYKDKNFDMLSINIDSSKQNWLYQVKRDSLTWKNIQDTAALKSQMAKNYFISTTPYNILIHPNKKIVAVDIKTDQLKDKLKELIP